MNLSIDDKSSKCHKLQLYNELVQVRELKLDEYIKGVLDKGKRLKFKLRSGTNALECELKRWGRGEGICQRTCKEGKVEDVHHFVMKCPTYARRREMLWNDITKVVQNNGLGNVHDIKSMSSHEVLKLILSSHIKCGVEGKSQFFIFFNTVNEYLVDICEVRSLVKFPPHNLMSRVYDCVKAENYYMVLLLLLVLLLLFLLMCCLWLLFCLLLLYYYCCFLMLVNCCCVVVVV